MAGLMIEHLKANQPEMRIEPKDVLCVKIAALCHDIGHGPFSHLFEELVNDIHLSKNPNMDKNAKPFFRVRFLSFS